MLVAGTSAFATALAQEPPVAGLPTARQIADSALASRVEADLTKLGTIDGLVVEVKRGRVKLKGQSASAETKSEAGKIVGAIEGVNSVDNEIAVRKP
jgi:osmotically-inducible protein OsmY